MMKLEGSGSIIQRHGSADPDLDPHQNVMDPEHCYFCMSIKKLHISAYLNFFSMSSILPFISQAGGFLFRVVLVEDVFSPTVVLCRTSEGLQ
jgi:hypothetical protein